MTGRDLVFWNVEADVLAGPGDGEVAQRYRTIIAGARDAPRRSSAVLFSDLDRGRRGRLIAAIGQVRRQRSVTTGRVGVRVEPFWLLETPVEVNTLLSGLDHHVTRAMEQAGASDPLRPKQFTRRSAEAITGALRRVSPEAADLLGRLTNEPRQISGLDGRRLREETDAVATSLQLAGLSMPDHMLPDWTETVENGEAFGAAIDSGFLTDLEDDLIADDLRRFDENATIQRIAGSASVIVDRDIRLTVINVNRKKLEHVHGVDLVYYDHVNDQATAVQYKRLEHTVVKNGSTQKDWVFRRKAELVKQLGLMKQDQRPAPTSTSEWRLSSSPSFFKFVRAEDFDPDGSSLLRGMYIPSDYLALGIDDGTFETGVRGGFQIGYNNARYLTRDTFVELVRRGWIGTRRTDKSSLAEMVAKMAEQHEVVLALRSQDPGGNTL